MPGATQSILIIEDSPYLAESLQDMFELHGYNVTVAKNGLDGVALAESERPDVILLDIRLPDLDGYEVYRRIRSTEAGTNIHIIIVTASESVKTVAKNLNLPLSDVLFKPELSVSDIISAVEAKLTTSTNPETPA